LCFAGDDAEAHMPAAVLQKGRHQGHLPARSGPEPVPVLKTQVEVSVDMYVRTKETRIMGFNSVFSHLLFQHAAAQDCWCSLTETITSSNSKACSPSDYFASAKSSVTETMV
jgi:hypothetical protein